MRSLFVAKSTWILLSACNVYIDNTLRSHPELGLQITVQNNIVMYVLALENINDACLAK